MTKILDIQQSIVTANGNISLAKELFTMLIDDLGMRVELIENSFQSGDMEQLGEHIHKLYGATAYCIVPQLRESAKILDDVLRNKEYENINELVNNVLNEMRQLINKAPEFINLDWLEYQA